MGFPDRLRWIVWKRATRSLWGHPWKEPLCNLWRFLLSLGTIPGTSCWWILCSFYGGATHRKHCPEAKRTAELLLYQKKILLYTMFPRVITILENLRLVGISQCVLDLQKLPISWHFGTKIVCKWVTTENYVILLNVKHCKTGKRKARKSMAPPTYLQDKHHSFSTNLLSLVYLF